MPTTNPFAAVIMKYIKETSKILCHGIDWVNCIGSECYVIQNILDSAPAVECYYSDIIYFTDNEYYFENSVRVTGNEKYILQRSDHVHVYCIKNAKFPFSWFSPRWSGLKTGLRDVEVPYRPDRIDSLNVLVLGMDSISHNQFLRKLPHSYNVLTHELGAVILNSYNILGDGTPAALFPILTGKSELEMPDARKINKGVYFHPKDFLFGQLKLDGYHTAYFEDMPQTGTFQYRFNGFKYQPADHYLRPLFLEATDLYCVGAVPRYALMLNLTLQFIKRAGKHFCFTFIADICHDDSNLIATMEDDLSEFLRALKSNGILENTLVFVMGDHGPRYSELRSIYQGKIEERLPFVGILLPEKVNNFIRAVKTSLRANADVLTTPFDIHTTILDAVGLSHLSNNYKVPGSDLPRGMSLLRPIPATRSCAEADVHTHWCACLQWVNVSQTEPIYTRVANAFCTFINNLVAVNAKCAKRELTAIEWVLREEHDNQYLNKDSGGGYLSIFRKSVEPSVENYQVKVVMSPGHAIFEGTVMFLRNRDQFLVSEYDISRVNAYGDEPRCIVKTHPHLSKFCYCVV
ncbi:uncharacterized protein LOC113228982 [Hyposmocoma kahamanoa]|uniref:uncharacterized protein LOC113228982 n=1 Tax=Hyposmocoma kahamanoa TaxID=1477025 RepID=UPI000E6D6886|nr:uncharacterized protein LOC113228982 [Hyposmocoma kahamanoa]